MNTLSINKTDYSPAVQYDADCKALSITGRCLEHSSWWIPIREDIQKLVANNLLEAIFIKVEYMNTAAKKHIFDILATDTSTLSDGTLRVKWISEEDDEDIEEVGEAIENGTKECKHIKDRENIIAA